MEQQALQGGQGRVKPDQTPDKTCLIISRNRTLPFSRPVATGKEKENRQNESCIRLQWRREDQQETISQQTHKNTVGFAAKGLKDWALTYIQYMILSILSENGLIKICHFYNKLLLGTKV